ncbi:MAG TPA: DEAD/DEAH box helicase, partial [archaeon]|nr:DEAD/DEAH box helicase [archaeon]
MKFEEMNIEKSVLDSLSSIGYEQPTRIQIETIPLIKQGHDVIGQSETGSGKTAAFGIPLIEKIVKGKKIQALVLAPTRELALQIAGEFEKFSKFKGLYIQTIYGGVSMEPQVSGLRRAEIVVGTPGRVLDHMRRGTLDSRSIKTFVLDEADKMIDMGFVEDIEDIERNIPEDRQTLLFSATMPDSLIKIRDRFTRNPKKVKTRTTVREDVLKQFYCDVDYTAKFSLLVHLIQQENPTLAIIFCNSRNDASSVARNLQYNNINATELHGGLSQQRREEVMEKFHEGVTRILVATDVAARGLDIKSVTHIFNYSIPRNAEEYTNRIGRTARAGESGKAISLLSRDDHDSFRRVLRSFSYDIEKMEVSDFRILPFRKHESYERR